MTRPTPQQAWTGILRGAPDQYGAAIAGAEDAVLRYRPAPGEWSAVEVLGHMVDTMTVWAGRVRLVATEERPLLPGYDQDAYVRDKDYQHGDPAALMAQFAAACESFAVLVEGLPEAALGRTAVHGENGPMTLPQCVESPLSTVPEHLAQFEAAMAAYDARR